MTARENLAMVKELLEAMRRHDVEKGISFYAEDCTLDMIASRNLIHGKDGLASAWTMSWAALPDQYYTENRMFATDEYVVFEGVMGGTHQGPYLNIPPTDKPVSVRVAFIWRIEGGKVKEWHSDWDAADLLR